MATHRLSSQVDNIVTTEHTPISNSTAATAITQGAWARHPEADLNHSLKLDQANRDPGLAWLDPNIDPQRFRDITVTVIGARFASKEHVAELLEHGIDISKTSKFNAADLISKGFVFKNRIGQGERAIIQTVGDRDYTGKIFLTREEIEYALPFMIPHGMEEAGTTLAELAQDMNKFMALSMSMQVTKAAKVGANPLGRSTFTGIETVFGDRLDSHVVDLIDNLRREFNAQINTLSPEQRRSKIRALHDGPIANEVTKLVADVGADTLRGIELDYFAGRPGGNMVDCQTPILTELDSAKLNFRSLAGIKIWPMVDAKQLRMSFITTYLASRGICNTGEPSDWDQRYVSLERYYEDFFPGRGNDPDLETTQNLGSTLRSAIGASLYENLLEILQPKLVYKEPVSGWQRALIWIGWKKEPQSVEYVLTAEDLKVIADFKIVYRLEKHGQLANQMCYQIVNTENPIDRLRLLHQARKEYPELCG